MRDLIKSILHKELLFEMTGRMSQNEFIRRVKEIHGNKYNYDKVSYVNNTTKVIITCPTHGDFLQSPKSHLYGKGCPKCGDTRGTTDKFIKDAKEIHGDKYGYSKVDYKNSRTPIKITCPIHGDFLQLPQVHLRGSGCLHCKHDNSRKTTNNFIERAKKIHGDLFDYSKVLYTKAHELVLITCKEHGDFLQTPNNHLKGNGCPICSESKGERFLSTILKKLKLEFDRQKTFVGCENIGKKKCRKYPFDFYIPKYNTVIEFDGIQHYQPVGFWGGNNSFEHQQIRDKIKNEYCIKNNIKMVRIPYTMKKEDIEPYIKKELSITS
jgi:hypothetical protein